MQEFGAFRISLVGASGQSYRNAHQLVLPGKTKGHAYDELRGVLTSLARASLLPTSGPAREATFPNPHLQRGCILHRMDFLLL